MPQRVRASHTLTLTLPLPLGSLTLDDPLSFYAAMATATPMATHMHRAGYFMPGQRQNFHFHFHTDGKARQGPQEDTRQFLTKQRGHHAQSGKT